MSIRAALRNKVWEPLLSLLRSGISPSQLAMSVALGAYLGIIPVLGVTTLLCAVVAIPLRLNLVAIQAVNWLVYPLQIVLIIPYFRGGEWLFREPPLDLAPSELIAMIKADVGGSVVALWSTTWHAVVVWVLVGIPVVTLSQHLLAMLFSRVAERMRQTNLQEMRPLS